MHILSFHKLINCFLFSLNVCEGDWIGLGWDERCIWIMEPWCAGSRIQNTRFSIAYLISIYIITVDVFTSQFFCRYHTPISIADHR